VKYILALLVALILASSASAASDPRVPGLQRKVTALQAQVADLQYQLSGLQFQLIKTDDRELCRWVYQSHLDYDYLNMFAVVFGQVQTPDATPSDGGACARVGLAPPGPLVLNPFGLIVA